MTEKELYDYIKSNFVYEKDGSFKRLDRRNSNGSLDKDGYLIIKIKGKQYKSHRLVFLYFNRRFPSGEIDHLNRNKTDNRIENLREATRLQNVHNSTPKGFGIFIDKQKNLNKKFGFHFRGKTYRFYTMEEAIQNKLKLGGRINYEFNPPKAD